MYVTGHRKPYIAILFTKPSKLSPKSLSDSSALAPIHWNLEQKKALPLYMELTKQPKDGVQLCKASASLEGRSRF